MEELLGRRSGNLMVTLLSISVLYRPLWIAQSFADLGTVIMASISHKLRGW